MPIGYLVAVTLVALGTLFAVVPLRRPGALGGLSFLLGPLVNELPFVAFYWLLGWTLLAINHGDLEMPGGGWCPVSPSWSRLASRSSSGGRCGRVRRWNAR